MERMNESGQWIVLIGFIVAISLFFLAIVVGESTLVGQTTSEAVLDFSKANMQELNLKTRDLALYNNPGISSPEGDIIRLDIQKLYSERKGIITTIGGDLNAPAQYKNITLHYNDGISSYNAYHLDAYTGF
jgi:hypothetical protein